MTRISAIVLIPQRHAFMLQRFGEGQHVESRLQPVQFLHRQHGIVQRARQALGKRFRASSPDALFQHFDRAARRLLCRRRAPRAPAPG